MGGYLSSLKIPFTGMLTSQSLRDSYKSNTKGIPSLLRSSPTHVILKTVEIGWDDCSSHSVHTTFPTLDHVVVVHILI